MSVFDLAWEDFTAEAARELSATFDAFLNNANNRSEQRKQPRPLLPSPWLSGKAYGHGHEERTTRVPRGGRAQPQSLRTPD